MFLFKHTILLHLVVVHKTWFYADAFLNIASVKVDFYRDSLNQMI